MKFANLGMGDLTWQSLFPYLTNSRRGHLRVCRKTNELRECSNIISLYFGPSRPPPLSNAIFSMFYHYKLNRKCLSPAHDYPPPFRVSDMIFEQPLMLPKMDRGNKWTIYISCKYHKGTYQVETRQPVIILHQWKLWILLWCLYFHYTLIMCKLILSSNCLYHFCKYYLFCMYLSLVACKKYIK